MAIGIDWSILAEAVKFYTEHDFKYIEVPWLVEREITLITCPDEERIIKTLGHGDLVGSAEQSFLQLQLLDSHQLGNFVACTPCFRNEPQITKLHQKTFMKVELYSTGKDHTTVFENMIMLVTKFFERYVSNESIHQVVTRDGFDLEIAGIEVGSYGLRRYGNHSWIYGTGVAEPRFSVALQELKNAH